MPFLRTLRQIATPSAKRSFFPDGSVVCDIEVDKLTLHHHSSKPAIVIATVGREKIVVRWRLPEYCYVVVVVWNIGLWLLLLSGGFQGGAGSILALFGGGLVMSAFSYLILLGWYWERKSAAVKVFEFLREQARAAETAALQ